MIDQHLSSLMRTVITFAGAGGFLLGLTLGLWNDVPWMVVILRAAILSGIFSLIARLISLRLLKIHVGKLKIRLEEEKKQKEAEVEKKDSPVPTTVKS